METALPPSWNDQEPLGDRGPLRLLAAPDHRRVRENPFLTETDMPLDFWSIMP